ncbi:MAG: glycosyltransferase [Pseudomonadota bacterium]|nr:glycosyltransferase [Pseudomonadota bacterium]
MGLRVLQVCESFGGGNYSSVTQICNGLAGRGHEVHLAFSRRAETPTDFAANLHPGVVLHEIFMTRNIAPVTDARALFALLALLLRVDPQVIHLHSSKAGFLGRVAAFLGGRGRTVFYSPRGLSFLQMDASVNKRRLFRWLEWGAARLGGTLVACSQGELDQVRNRLAPRSALLIENAVPVAMVPPRRPRKDGKVRIGTAGRISTARNPTLFAALAKRLGRDGVEFVWVGGGDDADRARLERNGVRVSGWLSRQEALARVSELDIYIQTSLWEGMPIAVIEAQVAGIPAVVTNVLGNRDIVVAGETGYVCRDADEMATRLEELVADPARRMELGCRARELALLRFDAERLLNELTAAYLAAVQRLAVERG